MSKVSFPALFSQGVGTKLTPGHPWGLLALVKKPPEVSLLELYLDPDPQEVFSTSALSLPAAIGHSPI